VSIITDYSMNRVEGAIPYIWIRRSCTLVITKNFLVLAMELVICWSTSYYQNDSF
jgi:hypothetical protein